MSADPVYALTSQRARPAGRNEAVFADRGRSAAVSTPAFSNLATSRGFSTAPVSPKSR